MQKILFLDAVHSNPTVHRIAHVDLLVPFFFSGHFAFLLENRAPHFFERIDAGHGYGQLRCGKRDGGVACSLSQARTHAQTPRTVRESLRVVDRTALRVLRIGFGVVVTVDVTPVVTACGEVDTRGEGAVGIELGILGVRPLDTEVPARFVVRQAPLTRHVISVIDVQTTREMVPPDIFRLRPNGPCTAGIDISRDLQVHVVADGEVVS